MNKKYLPYLLLAAMMVAILFIRECKSGSAAEDDEKATNGRGFNRQLGRLTYSKHARCRMACRHIDETEVHEIMQQGEINYRKSNLNNDNNREYAVEGSTHDKQKVRIVFAQEPNRTNVVTVIDLDTDWPCDCE